MPMRTVRSAEWIFQQRPVTLALDEAGDGATVLMLPALSSISTRSEMHALQERLAVRFRAIAVDWPGFGEAPKEPRDLDPDALSAYLAYLFDAVVPAPHAVIAAGHAATYVLAQFAARPAPRTRLVLVAPTWRGPLPTMAGGDRPLFGRIRRLVQAPVIGPLLYRLNVNGFMLQRMAADHVYANKGFLAGDRLAEKLRVVEAKGARFASVRFVTGGFDRVPSRGDFLALAGKLENPILLVYGAETPPRSRAEMEALAALPNVRTARLPHGKLAVHEEFPDAVAGPVLEFLAAEQLMPASPR
jgi:pimeloyl-ACP methyl ester carboxylesterase